MLPILFGRTTLREQPDLVSKWGDRIAGMHLPSLLTVLNAVQGRDPILDRRGELRVPTLVLVGEEDRAQPPARSRALAGAIPGAELSLIPKAGHLSALLRKGAVGRNGIELAQ